MSEELFYSETNPEYKQLTGLEWYSLNSYNYDSYRDFSDFKIIDMQNNYRASSLWKKFSLPMLESFCSGFNENNDRNRLLQRYFCEYSCFWDPQICFLEDCHSGNLRDIMRRDFHKQFSPMFEAQFNRKFKEKIDWTLTGGPPSYPIIGLNNLIENLGITSKLEYNTNNLAVNFEHLKREYRDSDRPRPLYVLEKKKCNDIIEALINVNDEKIKKDRIEMQKMFSESYKGIGQVRKPILSLMMWGPYVDFSLKKSDVECNIKETSSEKGVHVCTNFESKHYWMYTHSTRISCTPGPVDVLEGPVMTSDHRVLYPCNRGGCNYDCSCELCINIDMCTTIAHKEHLKEPSLECPVLLKSDCQDHKIDHPKNFKKQEDVVINKNIFYHNLELTDQPRKHTTDKLVFAGIKKNCDVCRKNVQNHFKHHMVNHTQCRFCIYQMKTAVDTSYWEKVCNICGKFFDDEKKLRYWHRQIHTSSWKCELCESAFSRKWVLRRHLIEIHQLSITQTDCDSDSESEEDSNENVFELGDRSDYTIEDNSEDDDIEDPPQQHKCQFCDKKFTVQRYLDTHIARNHGDIQLHKCTVCEKVFNLKQHLKRHIEVTHMEHESNICDFCGKNFSRVDKLKEHIKVIHLKESKKFVCSVCDKSFDRNWNFKRHEEKCRLTANSNK